MRDLIVRTLSRELHLRTADPDMRAALTCLSAAPRMPDRELTRIDLDIEPIGKFFRVAPPDISVSQGSPEVIGSAVYRQLGTWFVEEAGNAPVLHAGSAVVEGRPMAFIGDKRAGKTTLMLRQIQEGFDVQGDEYLMITAKGVIAKPRRLHVKETSLDVLPALADQIRAQPFMTDWVGNVMYACAPTFTGGDWTIAEGALGELVFLESNFGGSSILSPLGREDAFARLLQNAFMPAAGQARAVARLRRLAIDCGCWRLQTGDLDQAIYHLRRLAGTGYDCPSGKSG